MGKNSKMNKRKHSLDSSTTSGDISINFNISGEESLNVKGKSVSQQKNQDGGDAVNDNMAAALVHDLINNESMNENHITDITESSSAGNNREMMFNPSEILRGAQPRDDQFESYFDTLARRRSLSLGRPPNHGERQPDHGDYMMKLQKEDLLNKDHGKLTDLRSRTTDRTGSRLLTHPRKKIKTGIYNNVDFTDFHSNVQKSVDICPRYNDRVTCVDNCRQLCCVESSVNEHVEIVENVNNQLLEITNTAVSGQDDEIVSDRPVPIEISMPETVYKETTVNQSRPQMTEEQRKQIREVQLRTIFIEGLQDDLRKFYRHSPQTLK